MKTILMFLALVSALTLFPLEAAKADTVVYRRPVVHRRVVVGPRYIHPHRHWFHIRFWARHPRHLPPPPHR
jgi:hypothetical protein